MLPEIKLYSLSTCHHCAAAKQYFDDHAIAYDCVYVDRQYAEDRNNIMDVLRTINPSLSFPTIVVGDVVVAGFILEKVEDALQKYAD